MNPSDFHPGPDCFRFLIQFGRWPPLLLGWTSSTGQQIFENMPTLLPRESMGATSVVPASFQRPSPSDHRVGVSDFVYEATSGFTYVTACSLVGGKLTTSCYQDAASSCYRVVRTTPRTGLQPARLTVVTANGQARLFLRRTTPFAARERLRHDHNRIFIKWAASRLPPTPQET